MIPHAIMDYPGNKSLGSDVRDRVLGTYRQTLDLASQGNRQEASLGCDFILRLDPEFEPARVLLERLEDGEGAVAVDDLRPGGARFSAGTPESGPSTTAQEDDPLGSLDDLSLDLPGSGEPDAEASEVSTLAAELRGLLEARQFQDAVKLAQQRQQLVVANPELARLAQTAQSRLEAEPYIKNFLESARQAMRAGDTGKAERLLESARELDPQHPAIADLGQILKASGSRDEASAPAPQAPPPPAAAAPSAPSEGSGDPPGMETTGLSDLDLGASLDDAPLGDVAPGDEPGSLDLGEGDSGGDQEGDERIRALLQEGQEAFERKDFQGAIDAWSRIFLIDIDHQGAADRIEEARRLKAEHERQVEETFHEGMSHLEAGEVGAAQERFRKVLQLQPDHLAAKEHLHKIEAGEVPSASTPKTTTAEPPSAPAATQTPIPELPDDDQEEILQEDILVPPEPGVEQPSPAPAPSAATASTRDRQLPVSRNFLIIGGAVLVLVLLAGWFMVQQWDTFFPNAAETSASSGTADPIAAATRLRQMGSPQLALERLEQVGPGDPHYEDAQSLIAQWQAEADGESDDGEDGSQEAREDGAESMPEAQDRRRVELIEAARQASAERRYLEAEALLEEADALNELNAREQALMLEVREALEPIRAQVELVRGGDWDYVLPDLWRMREEDRSYPDVNLLLITAYHNLGVRDLQRGDPEGAEAQLQEALGLDPTDVGVERLLRFARSYRDRGKDLQYQIYVKYLPFRTL